MSQPELGSYFSKDYDEAKQRFLAAAIQAGAECYSYPIAEDASLTIDVALRQQDQATHTLVVSCGLHGVEGFFGSAVLLAWLSQASKLDCQNINLVAIHSLNPFGFRNLRRWNEDNVDLNRNFLRSDQSYHGSSTAYQNLNRLLNPALPPRRWDPFLIKAIIKISQLGMPAIKQAVAGGQYDYPRGLFFGGSGPAATTQIVRDNYSHWIGDTQNIIHLDLHTGLGKSATCKLLLESCDNPGVFSWYQDTFGDELVEIPGDATGLSTAYETTGSLGSDAQRRHASRNFRFAVAEFGTYPALRVLRSLRSENQAHFYGTAKEQQHSKAELLECFCPQSPEWRNQTAGIGLEIIKSATAAKWNHG